MNVRVSARHVHVWRLGDFTCMSFCFCLRWPYCTCRIALLYDFRAVTAGLGRGGVSGQVTGVSQSAPWSALGRASRRVS